MAKHKNQPAETPQELEQEGTTTETENTSADEIAGLQAQLAEQTDKYLRTVAEFDNYKKRTAKERADSIDFAVAKMLDKMIGVLDNLERAVDTAEDKDSPFVTGVENIVRQFKQSLQSMDVTEIEALGKPFDHNLHNAVLHIEDENAGENEIVQVLQKGYTYKDKMIRHSMVTVAN